jgi:hypothetical protein
MHLQLGGEATANAFIGNKKADPRARFLFCPMETLD